MEQRTYLQFGCGGSAPKGWLNFDASPTLRWEQTPVLGRLYTKNSERFSNNVKFGDIVRGLPVESDSCDLVYSSHVLEHMSLNECRQAIRNTFRILKPGGAFRVLVPDLKAMVKIYMESDDPAAATNFVAQTQLGREDRPRGLLSSAAAAFGFTPHLWMWDYESLALELEKAGFTDLRPATMGDTGDPMLAKVEDPERFDGAVAIHCVKPS